MAEGEGIGSTPKAMKKLTTVLSKNQKLHSMNVPGATEKFLKKVNIHAELFKQKTREEQAAVTKFIEEYRPILEAVKEARMVRTYLETDD
mgnify:CR=1 FL=1